MSFNIIDFTLFDRLDCSAESHYHKTFASRRKIKISNLQVSGKFSFSIGINHVINEENNHQYAEVVVDKTCHISFSPIYSSEGRDKFIKALDVAIGQYYIIEDQSADIVLTAKERGRVPSLTTPELNFYNFQNISFGVSIISMGYDTSIHVPSNKRNVAHIPISTMGPSYVTPQVGDRLIFIDSVNPDRDRTFTREVISVEKHAKCTCDVLYLDQDFDRLFTDHDRIDGLGLHRPAADSNNYTASFEKVSVYKRKHNFKEILSSRANSTGKCTLPIGNFANMKEVSKFITKDFLSKSENPHLSKKINYFGSIIPWKDYEELLKPIYDKVGHLLCDDLFLLTSNKSRPEYLVHIDYDEYDKHLPVVASFTWPVLNCNKNTTTIWYDCELNGQKIFTHGRQDFVITDKNIFMTEKDRYTFDSEIFNAVILKHNDWHTLYNNDNVEENRMLLQWRFKPTVTWEEIQQLFKTL